MKELRVLITAALFAAGSFAATPARADWNDVFPGTPVIPDPYTNLPDFIAADPGCEATVTEVVSTILAYGKAAGSSKKGDAEKAEKKIRQWLFPPSGQSQVCVSTAQRAYAVASIFLLDLENFDPNVQWQKYSGHVLSGELEVTLAAAFLANQGKIRFLDDAWKSRSDVNSRVRGAYDCADSIIYLDPKLSPVNLAATLLHEMDHLFRDKFLDVELLRSEFNLNSNGSAVDGWSSFLLMDEALAIVQSTFQQRDLQLHQVTVPAFWPGGGRWHKVTPYQLKDDVTFFAKDGPLNQLYLSCPKWASAETSVLPNFLQTIFLRKDAPMTCGKDALEAADREKIYESIFESYFPGAGSISPTTDENLSPTHHGMELGQLVSWVREHAIIRTPARDDDPKTSHSLCDDLNPGTCVTYRVDQFIDALSVLKTKIASSSPACDLYQQAVASGALNHYVGTQVGARPSTDGVRPLGPKVDKLPNLSQLPEQSLELPTRPPGTLEPKPSTVQTVPAVPVDPAASTDGVRPSLDSIRPCMDLQDKI